MMRKTRSLWLDRRLLDCPYHVALCLAPKEFRLVCRQLGLAHKVRPEYLPNEHTDAATHFFVLSGGKKHAAVVCLGCTEGKSQAQVAALLVHEAVHIWQDTLALLGEEKPGSELEAYAVQSIVQTLLEAYIRRAKRKHGST